MASRDPDVIASSARFVGLVDDAVATVASHARRGTDDPYADRLLCALASVPAARARHARRGIAHDITRATLGDLALWCQHTQRHLGRPGLCEDAFAWSQEYLRGDLVRLGAYQFAPSVFDAPFVALRHRETRALVTLALPTQHTTTSLAGRVVDPSTGAPHDAASTFDPRVWEVALAPGTPMLSLHIPADCALSLAGVLDAIADAYAFFAREPGAPRPRGVWGVAWLLDPQVRALIPRHEGVRDLQRACHLFPSTMPEAKTIRRLFGPEATRASIAVMPRDAMTSLQRAVADLLSDERRALSAKGGYVLNDALDVLAGRTVTR